MQPTVSDREADAAALLNKVPLATLAFWLVKMMATTVGETAADFLNADLGFGLTGTSWVVGLLTLAALVWQLRARRYVPAVYWLAVVMISVAGTLITDNLTDQLGVPLQISTLVFTGALAVVFMCWHLQEHTLSIHSITTPRRELYYWAAVLLTFALGTAAGDLLAEVMQTGYLAAAAIFSGAIVVVALLHYVFGLAAVPAFWLAYILTRPFGASLGDLLSQPLDKGGMGLGTTGTSALFLVAIAVLVFGMTRQQRLKAGRAADEQSASV